MNDGWIPVNERLPEGNAINPVTSDAYVYPVTVDFGGVTDVRYYSFYKGHWYNQSPKIMDDLVIAWRERPDPYKKKNEYVSRGKTKDTKNMGEIYKAVELLNDFCSETACPDCPIRELCDKINKHMPIGQGVLRSIKR